MKTLVAFKDSKLSPLSFADVKDVVTDPNVDFIRVVRNTDVTLLNKGDILYVNIQIEQEQPVAEAVDKQGEVNEEFE